MSSTVVAIAEPQGTPLSSNQAARRQRIVDVAMAMLEEREFERIQVKDVADGATVALGTLYRYFSSKEHLFGEVLVQWAGSLRASITRRPVADADPAARLEDVLHRSVRAFERQPQLAKLVGRLEMSEDPFAIDVLNRLDAVTDEVYLAVLEQLVPDEAARIVRVVDAVLDSALRSWSAGRLPIAGVYELLSDAVALLLPGDRSPRPSRLGG
jgi:TetR/AcrR family transcriptional regulator, cholesterol catabolism regulator